jgi:bla regulator protein blaR1
MTSFAGLLPSWTEALGWTLLNSLWQAPLVAILVVFALRFIPSKLSHARYIVACAGMVMIAAASLATFIYLNSNGQAAELHRTPYHQVQFATPPPAQATPAMALYDSILHTAGTLLAANMPLILLCWGIGFLLFTLRIVSGWWYISNLKTEAYYVEGEWNDRLQALSRHLGISQAVILAQSARVHAPMVIGYLKPVILVPAGMLSGLTTEQVEAIFIHELAHIRRHDYIINIIQSFIEALFFFNPFVWALSNIIRREREYCCDDTVLTKNSNALAYAHALAKLEEERLTRSVFALSLADNKKQLLNRIKRIMERSAKNYSGRDRLIPAILLIAGLCCASWLTIGTGAPPAQQTNPEAPADTVIKKKEKAMRYSRKSVITYDKNGTPHEEVVEEYSGDEPFEMPMPPLEALAPLMDFSFAVPQPPDAYMSLPVPPGVSTFEVPMAPVMRFGYTDTIPGKAYGYSFRDEEWEAFSKAFTEKFQTKFDDFYKVNAEDLAKLMKELEVNFKENFSDHEWQLAAMAHKQMSLTETEQAKAMAEHAKQMAVEAKLLAHEQKAALNEKLGKDLEVMELRVAEQQEALNEIRMEELDIMEQVEEQLNSLKISAEHMKQFEEDLKTQLVKDGYLDKNDKIENIHWDSNGEIEVNGKMIKDTDRAKYNSLHDKYFKNDKHPRKME